MQLLLGALAWHYSLINDVNFSEVMKMMVPKWAQYIYCTLLVVQFPSAWAQEETTEHEILHGDFKYPAIILCIILFIALAVICNKKCCQHNFHRNITRTKSFAAKVKKKILKRRRSASATGSHSNQQKIPPASAGISQGFFCCLMRSIAETNHNDGNCGYIVSPTRIHRQG